MGKISKRIAAANATIDRNKLYSLDEAVKLVKGNATTKFDETVEIAVNLGVDPKHADQMVRGVVALPNGTGKTVRVAVFAKGDNAEEAKKAGAELVGADDLDRKSTRLNSSHRCISYAVFCLKKKKPYTHNCKQSQRQACRMARTAIVFNIRTP